MTITLRLIAYRWRHLDQAIVIASDLRGGDANEEEEDDDDDDEEEEEDEEEEDDDEEDDDEEEETEEEFQARYDELLKQMMRGSGEEETELMRKSECDFDEDDDKCILEKVNATQVFVTWYKDNRSNIERSGEKETKAKFGKAFGAGL